jgi:hypothetical protein
MDEEPEALAIAAGPKPLAAGVAAGEVDVGGVLHCHDPTALCSCGCARGAEVDDGLGHDLGRGEKARSRELAAAPAAEAAQHERAGGHDLLGYDIAAPIKPDILEATALHAPAAVESLVRALESDRGKIRPVGITTRLRRNALPITLTEEAARAAAAITGESRMPKNG